MDRLRLWVMNYPLRTDDMSEATWNAEFKQFCTLLRAFRDGIGR